MKTRSIALIFAAFFAGSALATPAPQTTFDPTHIECKFVCLNAGATATVTSIPTGGVIATAQSRLPQHELRQQFDQNDGR
ncbi:hypothetical protein ACEPAI_7243 [Sanghuangporus weigelae]